MEFMGPQCPHCGAVYEWTCGELEEQVTAPKVYFCQDCRGLFILTPDEVEALQERFRPALEEANAPDEGDLGDVGDVGDLEADEAPERAQPQPSPAQAQARPMAPMAEGPLDLRERVVVTGGPHKGITGSVAVLDGDLVTIRVEGSTTRLRVEVNQLRRAA